MLAAGHIAEQAIALVSTDTEASYLQNQERQWAVERLLIRLGEALKDLPPATLTEIGPDIDWSGPKGFRDLASHWYEDGLDHRLIWRALQIELPSIRSALAAWLRHHPDP